MKKVLDKPSGVCYNKGTKEKEVSTMRDTITAITCPFCGADHEVKVNFKAYVNWINGELIQNAMPDLTPTEREQLISKLCPKCQEKIFG